MKRFYLKPALFFLFVCMLQSCSDTCKSTQTWAYYEPVYTSMDEIRSSVAVTEGKEIQESGKIYYINNYLLINEPNNGIHIIDNSNPSNPVNKGFLSIPGNFDLAAVDGFLYADSYIDLVVFDISNIEQPVEVRRVENVFPNYNSYGYYLTSNNEIVTDWKLVENVQELDVECDQVNQYGWGFHYAEGIALDATSSFSPSRAVSPANPGVGGSMARFTITNSHLYMVDQTTIYIADINNPSDPVLGGQMNIGWGKETIFPYDTLLFIGANNGMSVYDVSNPLAPEHVSTFNHVNSCDPVVFDGQYAYVTLRSGNECAGFTNQLDVLDMSDIKNPQLVKTYPMFNPHGLSISNNKLYVCDGDAGLKIYNAADRMNIDKNLLKVYSDINAYDVIVVDCLVMLIGEDGLHQYRCSEFEEIQYLSYIPFK